MSSAYTLKQITDVKDSAAEFGIGEIGEARFAKGDLETEQSGMSYHHLKPDKRQSFGHKHDEAEEVYVVLGGSGRVKLDDEVVELRRLDAIRVAPTVVRAFEAGPDGLEVLAFGQRFDGDGEVIPNWWSD